MAKAYIPKEKAGADMMELEKYTLGSLKKAVFEGNVDEGSLMAGQVAGMIHEIKPVKQILEEMMSELQDCLLYTSSAETPILIATVVIIEANTK